MRLTAGYRSARWWLSVAWGAAALALAVTVLKTGAPAPATVRFTGSVPKTAAARAYDIVVSAPGAAGAGDAGAGGAAGTGGAGGWADLAGLDALSGGITLDQYDVIRRLAGVEVAAPLTTVGYVPFTVSVPVALDAPPASGAPGRVTVTVRLRSDNGLSAVTWDDVTMAYPAGRPGPRPAAISIRLDWTFQPLLVAVDPVAEARLLHLDAAVSSGRYLPAPGPARSRTVPMLMAGSIPGGEVAEVTVDPPAAGAASGPASAAVMLTAGRAYQQLVREARQTPGDVRSYWTAAPVSYGPAAGGALAPRPAAGGPSGAWDGAYMWAGAPAGAGAGDVPFRTLTQHVARGAGAMVRVVGVFDPARVASAPATPSPYRPELLAGADTRSRQLLGDRPLAADDAPGGYPDPAASLVIPLADIGAFTGGYSGADGAAPIGSIRVRVAGAAGDAPASQDRIRSVAQEIVRATGLRVQVLLGATAVTRVVDLPAGRHGRPALRVVQVWYGSGIRTTVRAGLRADSVVLSELGLLAGEVVIAWDTWRLVRARRGELATLRALGWRPGQLGWRLLTEFGVAAVVAVAAAVLAGYAAGAALAGLPSWAWLLPGIPAAPGVVLAAARPRRPRRRGAAAMPAHPVRALLRTPARGLVSVFVIAVACTALSLAATARWAWHDTAGTWAGRPVSWPGGAADLAAAAILAALAAFTVADMNWVTLGDRTSEVRTLRAMGWSPWALIRLMAWNSVGAGLAGGLLAGAADLAGGLAVTGTVPPRLVAVAGLATVTGVALSLLAAGLSAISRQVLGSVGR